MDSEIIKALECCKNDDCDNCPNTFGNCYSNLAGAALDLINRQQAEIERLKTEKDNLIKTYAECQVENIKEFVKELKEEIQCSIDVGGHYVLYEVIKDIDNLAKEWVGADDA
ncbi:MAG: hypothetical protein IJN27_01765 [Oscillospiraceae bacterium]|nr:hypothetical protein [Oscillospiraceae bacterium]